MDGIAHGGVARRRRSRSRFGSATEQVSVYVGNLPADANEEDLRNVLSRDMAGVLSVRVPRSVSSSRTASRGFAFVDFSSSSAATAGVTTLSGAIIQGQRLRARIATDRASRGAPSYEENTKYEWGGSGSITKQEPALEPVNGVPTLQRSGVLLAASVKDAALKSDLGHQGVYMEPSDAALPCKDSVWRIFVFKGDTALQCGTEGGAYKLTGRKCFMFGRDRDTVQIPLDNPSCSKLHAVIQFRYFQEKNGPSGSRPYIFDLDSRNGSFLNGERVDGRRFIEIRSKDVLRFGVSNREYVLIEEPRSV